MRSLKLRARAKASAQRRAIVPVDMRSTPEKFATVDIRLLGANPASTAEGVDRLAVKTNYFVGKDSTKWRFDVPTYAGAKFHDLYPGIDLLYRGDEGRLEYDFALAPQADPKRIRLRVAGAQRLDLARNGDLII